MRYVSFFVMLICVQIQGQWFQLPDFLGTPREDAAAFAVGANVYIGTGMEEGGSLTNDWYRFDGSNNQWSTIAPLPATPRQSCSAFVYLNPNDDYGYLFGGIDLNGPLNELWRYDPSLDSWQQMASLPGEARYASVAFRGGYIATGVFADGSATNELWKYDPASDSWQDLAPLPGTPRHRANASEGFGPMVIGGLDSSLNVLSDCWSYNSQSNTWSECASLPEGRYSAMSGFAAYDEALIGGSTNDSTIVETGYRFNFTSWQPIGYTHPGGTRRSGIMVQAAGSSSGYWHTYIGLGLSNDGMLFNDWFMISGAFGLSEYETSSFTLHPNPGTTSFTLQLPSDIGPADIEVLDLSGRMIMNGRLTTFTVESTTWRSGFYTIQVIGSNGYRYRAQWVKL